MWMAAFVIGAVLAGAQGEVRTVPKEPGPGELRPGEMVFVNDGACPAGQIKRVVGGSNRAYRTDTERQGSRRQVSCVPRSQ